MQGAEIQQFVHLSPRKRELLVGQRPTKDIWWPKGPLKYLGGRRPLKVPFSLRKKINKLLNFSTIPGGAKVVQTS